MENCFYQMKLSAHTETNIKEINFPSSNINPHKLCKYIDGSDHASHQVATVF